MPFFSRRVVAIIGCFALVTITMTLFAQELKKPQQKAKNLKVIPPDISHEDLDKQMDFFCASLQVKCNYCHADSKTRPGKLDFASDSAAHHKEDAREMIEMTYSLNEKYFDVARTEPAVKQVVNCYTCHRGEEMPIIGFDSIAARKH